MTIREIARLAGVSISTVSRAMNHVPTVDPHLARRVHKIAERLHYYPNSTARALVSGRSRMFGLVLSEITDPFTPGVVQAFEDLAVQHNYEVLITSTSHNLERADSSVRRMVESRVKGIAVLASGMDESIVNRVLSSEIRVVLMDWSIDTPATRRVRVDYEYGVRQGVQHLAALRHQRIAFVSGAANSNSMIAMRAAFEECMREIQLAISPQVMLTSDHTVDGGADAFRRLRSLRVPPTAVFCSNDLTAIGVMKAAYERGISVPSELSIIGFNDIRIAQFMTPPLSTIRIPQAELANLAFQALLDEKENTGTASGGCVSAVRTHLVLRNTTALAAPRT